MQWSQCMGWIQSVELSGVRILGVGETVEEKLMALRDQSIWVSAAEHPWLLEHLEERRWNKSISR